MRGRLVGLDGLRGIAALAVFLHHAHMASNGGEPAGAAFLAVDFFFMLSGYVMARTYEAGWAGASATIPFLTIRIRRLWPTMTVGAMIGAIGVWAAHPAGDAMLAMLNIAFIPYFLGWRIFPLNGPAWSIFFELVANLVHVLALRRLSTSALAVLAGAMVPLLYIGGAVHALDVGSRPDTFLLGFPRVLLSYTVGVILWRSWRDAPAFAVSTPFAFLAMPVFFGATALIGGLSWFANIGFVLLICPLIIAGGLQVRPDVRWAKAATIAGAASFPLYAVHDPILWMTAPLPGGWAVGMAATIVVVGLFPSVRRAVAGPGASRRSPVDPSSAPVGESA